MQEERVLQEKRVTQEHRIRPEERVMQIDINKPNLGLTIALIVILTITLI